MQWLLIAMGIVLFVVVPALPPIIWFYLAPRNMFFTFIKEGTAKVVVRGDAIRKVLIQFEGHILDADWNVVPGREWHPFGGLRWVGIWPLDDVYVYLFRWANVLHDGTIVQHEPEWLDYILLKDDVYYFHLDKAEDIELLPLEVDILLTTRIINPYKALFQVQDWLETTINRFKPMGRDKIAQGRYEELVAQKSSMGGQLFNDSSTLRQELCDRYGVEVAAVEVKDIDPPEDQRLATLRKWEAEREAERIEVIAQAEAGRVATEYGAVKRQGLAGLFIRLLEGRYGRRE